MKDSFIKINEKYAAALSYFFGPVTGLIFYIGETASGNNNSFVKFHALQSTILFGALGILLWILPMLRFIPFMGLIISFAELVYFAGKIFMMFSAFTGQLYKTPVVGDICHSQVYR